MRDHKTNISGGKEVSTNQTVIKPSMGLWKAWAMVVGTMMGSGVFMVPSLLAPYGKIGLFAWVASSVGAIIIALAFANLARRMPKVGGCYAYTRAGFGDFSGFLIAWVYWISVWASCAAITVAFVGYLGYLFPVVTSSPAYSIMAGLVVIAIIAMINLKGIKEMGTVQLVTSLLKISPLILIGLYGVFSSSPSNFDAYVPSGEPLLTAFSACLIITMWAFMGLDAVTVPAADVINPKKTIPRALIIGTSTAALIYIVSNYAVMSILPQSTLITSTAPFADAAMSIIGPIGGGLIAFGALISCFGALNSNVCVAAQVPMAAAQDNLFPKPFGKMSKNGVPAFGILVAASLGGILLIFNFSRGLLAAFEFILLIATITTLVAYAFATIAGLLVEARDKTLTKAEHFKEGLIAFLAFGVALWAMAGSGFESVYWAFFLILAGIPVYVWMKRKSASP